MPEPCPRRPVEKQGERPSANCCMRQQGEPVGRRGRPAVACTSWQYTWRHGFTVSCQVVTQAKEGGDDNDACPDVARSGSCPERPSGSGREQV